nr:putative reverse transcriptase domain-containing protein [Tanacetum cinerariifolium]
MIASIKVEEEIICDLERLGIEIYVRGQHGYWASMRIEPDLISRIKEAQKEDSEIWTITFKTLCLLNYALMIRHDYDITSSLRRGALHKESDLSHTEPSSDDKHVLGDLDQQNPLVAIQECCFDIHLVDGHVFAGGIGDEDSYSLYA